MTRQPRFSFCDDLGSPELCIIMDPIWWLENESKVLDWLREQGEPVTGHNWNRMMLVSEAVRTLFILKFQDFTG